MVRSRARRWSLVLSAVLALVATACGEQVPDVTAGPSSSTTAGGTIRLYTSVTEDTVDAVVGRFERTHPQVRLDVFRAPTGEINARLAAERRDGEVTADVLWLTDPLSMEQYAADGLLASWTPDGIDAVPAEYRTTTFFGTRILDLVLVYRAGTDPVPRSWQDLAARRDLPVAVPDPGFAGSAFAALAWFGLAKDYGLDFYRSLDAAGAVQVQAPGDVVTGVAEGRFWAGITLARTARAARDKGSPIDYVLPEPGAIAFYSPIAVVTGGDVTDLAESFAAFTITRDAQEAVAATGWQPIRSDVAWEQPTAPAVTVDWDRAFAERDSLLARYRALIGG